MGVNGSDASSSASLYIIFIVSIYSHYSLPFFLVFPQTAQTLTVPCSDTNQQLSLPLLAAVPQTPRGFPHETLFTAQTSGWFHTTLLLSIDSHHQQFNISQKRRCVRYLLMRPESPGSSLRRCFHDCPAKRRSDSN